MPNSLANTNLTVWACQILTQRKFFEGPIHYNKFRFPKQVLRLKRRYFLMLVVVAF